MVEVKLGSLVIDCPDPLQLATFYSKLLGLEMNGEDAIVTPEGREIWFQQVENYQPPTWPTQERGQQMHVDVTVADLAGAVTAVEEIGGRLAGEQPGEGWRVMLDPAGHPFCLVPASDPKGSAASGSGIGRWTSLTIDCADGGQLARFYEALFGMKHTDHGGGFHSLDHEGQPSFYFQPVEGYQPPSWPTQERGQQMHLDFYVDDLEVAVAAAESLGARFAEEQPGDYFRVMIDPAGHPFCLCRRR